MLWSLNAAAALQTPVDRAAELNQDCRDSSCSVVAFYTQNVCPDLPPSLPRDEGKRHNANHGVLFGEEWWGGKSRHKAEVHFWGNFSVLNWKLSHGMVCKFHDSSLFVTTHTTNENLECSGRTHLKEDGSRTSGVPTGFASLWPQFSKFTRTAVMSCHFCLGMLLCGCVEPLERFSTLCAFLIRLSLRLGFKFVWALTLQGLPLKAFQTLPGCSGIQACLAWPAWHRHGEGCALCLAFFPPVRLLKLIYWAADLSQNSHERHTLRATFALRPENFCTK